MSAPSPSSPIGPVDGTQVPRFAGSATFARLPRIDEVSSFDVALLGAPFDGGVSFRPGARFGPSAIRQASRHLRPAYNPAQDVSPYGVLQAVDAGDVPCNPFACSVAKAVSWSALLSSNVSETTVGAGAA